MSKYWSVQVSVEDEQILNIGSNYLSGCDLSSKEKEIVHECGLNLINFVGRTAENQGTQSTDTQHTIPGSAIAPSQIAEVVDYVENMQKSEVSSEHILNHVTGTLRKLLVS